MDVDVVTSRMFDTSPAIESNPFPLAPSLNTHVLLRGRVTTVTATRGDTLYILIYPVS